jgi:hypothetical protein
VLGAASGFTWPAAGKAISPAATTAKVTNHNVLFNFKAPSVSHYALVSMARGSPPVQALRRISDT